MKIAKNNEKKTVIFDLDSTLNDMHDRVRDMLKHHYHIEMVNYEIPKSFPFTEPQVHELVEKHGLLTITQPLPGARELFNTIHELGLEIGILTARKCFKNTADNVTIDWLQQHHLKADWIDIVAGDKHLAIKARFVNCLLFLDDNPGHLLDVYHAKVAEYVGTLHYPWIKELPAGIMKFNNLLEVNQFLKHI
jgi:uncharacterized HAD superfamily protein